MKRTLKFIVDCVRRMKKVFIHNVNRFLNVMILSFLQFMPVRENIVLECESDMEDNPMAFFEHLLVIGWNKRHKIIWIVKDVETAKQFYSNTNVLFFNRNSFHSKIEKVRFLYYINTSKWILFSHPFWMKKWKKKQYVISTTHSVAQLKASGNLKNVKICDYVLTCNDYCSEIKRKTFGEDVVYLQLGLPRLDWMYHHTEEKTKLASSYQNKRIILSMETFKQSFYWSDSVSNDCFAMNVIKTIDELTELDTFLEKNDCVLVVKIHHLQDVQFLKQCQLKNIIYLQDKELLKKQIIVNKLLENADILLTDYSSVFYDYLLMDKPIGFMVSDINEYSRGFIMDNPFDEMPGEKLVNLGELKTFLKKSLDGIDNYKDHRAVVREKVFLYNDGKNCERLYKWITNCR